MNISHVIIRQILKDKNEYILNQWIVLINIYQPEHLKNIITITKIRYHNKRNNIITITKINYQKHTNNIRLITKIRYWNIWNNTITIIKINYQNTTNNDILITKINYQNITSKKFNVIYVILKLLKFIYHDIRKLRNVYNYNNNQFRNNELIYFFYI